MGINEEIYEDFFRQLKEDKDFPDSIIEELKNLWESGETITQDKIFEVIERGVANVGEDQKD